MICLFSSIKEIFTGQQLISFQGGACKARKSVIIDPCTCFPDSNSFLDVSLPFDFAAGFQSDVRLVHTYKGTPERCPCKYRNLC